MRPLICRALLSFAAVGCMPAQFHLPGAGSPDSVPKKKTAPAATSSTAPASPPQPNRRFDYYVLGLSWAGTRFLVDGLWPQAAEGASPESCGSLKPPSKAVISLVLPLMPNADRVRQ